MINFPFCIHNHQPAGNFDFVLEDAYQKAYWPFLRLLYEYPAIKMTIHNSGFLLEWIVKKHPEYIELMKEMVKRGQIEVMGGGFYEPILAVIPERDRIAQIKMMAHRIEELFGSRPTGLWLAERVWEPTLPATLNAAGVEYALVDDFHFIKAGLRSEALGGYFISEDQGKIVKLFPGSEALRYLIPFRDVAELEGYFDGLKDNASQGYAAIYGDDGEKFGVWPGTNKLVFRDGWLKRFFEMIGGMKKIKSLTLGRYADEAKPLGRVYLPTCSYMEMGEWSLPVEAAREYHDTRDSLGDGNSDRRIKRFMQGGTWRGFFAKYPESNWMNKRMLSASGLLEKKRAENILSAKVLEEAATYLYKAQCNDAYWHGIFGGLYLPHLRTEVYRNILFAEDILSEGHRVEPSVELADVDADGHEEVIIRGGDSALFISPRHGGAAFELDSTGLHINAMNVLSRWPEAYHDKVLALADEDEDKGNGAKSIHDSVKSKEKGIKRFLITDSQRRGSLVDRFISCRETHEAFVKGTNCDAGDFAGAEYEVRATRRGAVFSRSASLGSRELSITKEVSVNKEGGFSITSAIGKSGDGVLDGYCYGLEFNVLLPGCDGPFSSFEVIGGEGAVERFGLKESLDLKGVSSLRAVDGFTGAVFCLNMEREARVWSFPIYTVTLSEAGFERCFQGSSILLLFPLHLKGDKEGIFKVGFSLEKLNS